MDLAKRDRYIGDRIPAGCNNFKGLVHQLNDGQDVPSLSEAFIHKCLADIELRNA
ncbi:MAG: hypothetical protein AB8G86_07695 [Saprospiraceae bacterium]